MAHRQITFASLAGSLLIAMSVARIAQADTGQACIVEDADSHAKCLAMIEAVRELLHGDGKQDQTCAMSGSDDFATTNAVIDWIKTHPERQDEDLAMLVREALVNVDPCAQGPLIPTGPETDPLDVD